MSSQKSESFDLKELYIENKADLLNTRDAEFWPAVIFKGIILANQLYFRNLRMFSNIRSEFHKIRIKNKLATRFQSQQPVKSLMHKSKIPSDLDAKKLCPDFKNDITFHKAVVSYIKMHEEFKNDNPENVSDHP